MTTISVQDPFELSYNVSGVLTNQAIVMWLTMIEKAYKISIDMTANVYKTATNPTLDDNASVKPWGLAALLELEFTENRIKSRTSRKARMLSKPQPLVHPPAAKPQVGPATQPQVDPSFQPAFLDSIQFDVLLTINGSEFPFNTVWNSEIDYYRNVCQVIRDIFTIGLKFTCRDLDVNNENTAEHEHFKESPCKKRKVEELISSSPLARFSCTTFYQSWCSRKQGRKILLTMPMMDLLTSEGKVSEYIIDQLRCQQTVEPSEPVAQFICVLHRYHPLTTPGVSVQLQSVASSKESKATFRDFIRTYLPKVTNQIIEMTFALRSKK